VAFLASWWLSYWSQHQQAQAPATTNTATATATATGTTTGTSNTGTGTTGSSTAAVVSEPSPWFFLGIYVVINTAVACTSLGKVLSPFHF